jgi:uncharacterized protein RhaS with RHS repeats
VQGRWISQDPIGFDAGDANLYRYVGNEATGATDPSGQELLDLEELRDRLIEKLEAEKAKALAKGQIDEANRINRILSQEHQTTTSKMSADKHTKGTSRKSGAALKKSAANLTKIEQTYHVCITGVRSQPIDWVVADHLAELRDELQEQLRTSRYKYNHGPAHATPGQEKRILEQIEIEKALKELDEAEELLKKQKYGAVKGVINKVEGAGRFGSKCLVPLNAYMEVRDPLLDTVDEIKSDDESRWHHLPGLFFKNLRDYINDWEGFVVPGGFKGRSDGPPIT